MKRYRIAALSCLMVGLAATVARAADRPLVVVAAGSLRAPLTELVQRFSQATGIVIETRFASSGLLRQRIEKGEKVDMFASADLVAPQTLAKEGLAGPVVLFARNRMCAMVRPGLAVTPATLLATLLDPKITVGTSTPKADPAGDYAWAILARAETVHPGSRDLLQVKARRFLARPNPPKPPEGANGVAWMLGHGEADLFLAYCSGGKAFTDHLAGATVVELPPDLAVTSENGLTLVTGSTNPAAARFALFMLSFQGQEILARNGFTAVLPPPAER